MLSDADIGLYRNPLVSPSTTLPALDMRGKRTSAPIEYGKDYVNLIGGLQAGGKVHLSCHSMRDGSIAFIIIK